MWYDMEGTISEQNTVLQVLLEAQRAKLTGTLMLTCENQLSQIQLQSGELQAVAWRAVKGQAALERLLQVRSGQYRFMENVSRMLVQPDLPNIRDVISRTLATTEAKTPVSAPAEALAAVASPARRLGTNTLSPTTPNPVSTIVGDFDLNSAMLQRIHAALTDEVGKRAWDVMSEAAEKKSLGEKLRAGAIPRSQAREWIVEVAQGIRDPLNRTAFIRRAVEIAEL